jgi:hypothetical protein
MGYIYRDIVLPQNTPVYSVGPVRQWVPVYSAGPVRQWVPGNCIRHNRVHYYDTHQHFSYRVKESV